MSRLIWPCQLSQERTDYIWCFIDEDDYKSDSDDDKYEYIHIMPKNYYHWDQKVTKIIGPIDELEECSEGLFQYDAKKDIFEIMKDTGIKYSNDAQDEIDMRYGYHCNCTIEFPDPVEGYCKICDVVH
jgi:hypothetical protein